MPSRFPIWTPRNISIGDHGLIQVTRSDMNVPKDISCHNIHAADVLTVLLVIRIKAPIPWIIGPLQPSACLHRTQHRNSRQTWDGGGVRPLPLVWSMPCVAECITTREHDPWEAAPIYCPCSRIRPNYRRLYNMSGGPKESSLLHMRPLGA
jgi:hypothetical protein